MIKTSVSDLIGHTPMLETKRFSELHKLGVRLLAKLECFNPGGSVKDRPALQMVLEAEASGQLTPGGTIVEPTSGNTGIGLAAVAAMRGYKCIIIMTDTMSIERRKLITQYGAELILMPGVGGMKGCIEKAKEIVASTPNSVLLMQFENPANPKAHELTTGPEIYEDTQGNLDVFVAGVGTGGTLCGAGAYLKSKIPSLDVVAIEPSKSPLLSGGEHTPHGIQGIGPGFVPANYKAEKVDSVVQVTDEEALQMARDFARTEGLLVGISSGAALAAAVKLAQLPQYAGKTIAVVLPDTGERYLSTALFNEA